MPKEESSQREKEHIIDVLERTRLAVKQRDILALKDLSNQTIHQASIYQDTDSIAIAVIIYALFKTLGRPDYIKYDEWPDFIKTVDSGLNKALNDIENDRMNDFSNDLLSIRKAVNKLSGNFKQRIEEVFRRAMISKASRIYEHGISMDKTANLLGITVFELAEYAGKTGISDINLNISLSIDKRIKRAMEFFK